MEDYIRKDSGPIKELLGQIEKARTGVREVSDTHRPMLDGERYLSAQEVMTCLHISPRTLQTLRDTHTIAFTTVMGKILYPERELNRVLQDNYRQVSRELTH